MGGNNSSFDSEIAPLKKAISWAAYLGVAVLAVAAMTEEIQKLLEGPVEPRRLLHACLFCSVLVLGGLWIVSGLNELGYASRWLSVDGGYVPPSNIVITGTIAGIGVVIGVLAIMSKWIDRYLLTYLLYLVIDLAWWKVRRNHYSQAIVASRRVAKNEISLNALTAMESYYVRRPHYRRCAILILLTMSLLIVQKFVTAIALYQREIAGYVGALILLVGSEIPIQVWRYKLAGQLDRYKAEAYKEGSERNT